MNEKILKSIQDLKQNSKERKFSQTYDLVVNLREFDAKKPENRIDENFSLPRGRGKEAHIVIFSDIVKHDGAEVFNSGDIAALTKDKRAAKKMAKQADFLFGDPKLMPVIGKNLGTLLGPRGKVPKVLGGNVDNLVKSHKNATRIRVKDAPVIQCVVGTDKMKDEDVAENVEAIIRFLEKRLPGGKSNIGKTQLKLTMGKPVRLEGM